MVMSVTDITIQVMSVTVNTTMKIVGRWEPDGRGRLQEAALALFAQRGFDQTTAAEIAARAGLTEPNLLPALRGQARSALRWF